MKLKKHDRIIFTSSATGDQLATVHLVGRGGNQVGRVLILKDGDNQRWWVSIKSCQPLDALSDSGRDGRQRKE